MDMLPAKSINKKVYSFDEESDKPMSPYFETVGKGSRNAIKNMGSTFIFFMINIVILIVAFITKSLNKTKVYDWLKKKFLWNHFIRF